MITPAFWLRYLPTALRSKIEHRSNLLKILNNTGWLFFDKILRMGVGLFVGVWVARYLGPEQFGLFNYATAIVALFAAIATLGLNNIVVRDLVSQTEDANVTLGTAFVLQMIGGSLAFLAAVVVITFIRPDDSTARIIVVIFGLAMVFKATDVVRYWFESKVQSKYVVWVENAAFLLFATIKVILIFSGARLITFAWIVLAETILVALLLLVIYGYQGHYLKAWKFQCGRAKNLLRDSWPLIISGLTVTLYMRIDQIMLGQLLGDKAVGVYSAAVRLSEVWYFIPVTIAASVYPAIIQARKQSIQLYNARLQNLFELMALIALVLALPISFMSEFIMSLLYGPGFAESAQVLVIHVWTGFFVFSGVVSSRWFVVENLQKYIFYRTLAGCGVNIGLNFLLIPKYGPAGSAWASVISQATASFLFNVAHKKTRPLFLMQLQAMTLPRIRANMFQKFRPQK